MNLGQTPCYRETTITRQERQETAQAPMRARRRVRPRVDLGDGIALAVLPRMGDWRDRGLCVGAPDPELWFPGRGESTREAKAICRACPVRAECLEYALEAPEEHGIWGGTSERERRRIRRQRARFGDAA